jgi:hypothetical protein
VDVDPVLHQTQALRRLLFLSADEEDVDIRLLPHLVVGQTAQQDRRENLLVLLYPGDKGREGIFIEALNLFPVLHDQEILPPRGEYQTYFL